MTIEEIIKKAIEGGYLFKARYRSSSQKIAYENKAEMPALKTIPEMLMEPLFWQSLGKAMGWSTMPLCESCHRQSNYYTHCGWCNGKVLETWQYEWHRFIDHLADGNTPESFFETL